MLRESLDQVLRELLVEVPKTTTKFTNYDSVKSSDSNPDMQVRHLRHVRRNYQQNPFQKHRHHKHHQRKPNITKERKEGNVRFELLKLKNLINNIEYIYLYCNNVLFTFQFCTWRMKIRIYTMIPS